MKEAQRREALASRVKDELAKRLAAEEAQEKEYQEWLKEQKARARARAKKQEAEAKERAAAKEREQRKKRSARRQRHREKAKVAKQVKKKAANDRRRAPTAKR